MQLFSKPNEIYMPNMSTNLNISVISLFTITGNIVKYSRF